MALLDFLAIVFVIVMCFLVIVKVLDYMKKGGK